MVWQTNHDLRMELIEAILNDETTDDSSVEDSSTPLTPDARVEHPTLVSVEHPKVKKKTQIPFSPSRRSKRLSPRRRMRPKKYSE
jgi:hypothetical protein